MTQRIRVVAGAVIRDGTVLVALRGPGMSTPGRWELPGGKVEPGESDGEALIRELHEELGITVAVGAHLGTSAQGRIELVAYLARLSGGTVTPTEHAEVRWVGPGALGDLEWADADVPLVARLRDKLSLEGRS